MVSHRLSTFCLGLAAASWIVASKSEDLRSHQRAELSRPNWNAWITRPAKTRPKLRAWVIWFTSISVLARARAGAISSRALQLIPKCIKGKVAPRQFGFPGNQELYMISNVILRPGFKHHLRFTFGACLRRPCSVLSSQLFKQSVLSFRVPNCREPERQRAMRKRERSR